METENSIMRNSPSTALARLLSALLVLLALGAVSLRAEDVIVTATLDSNGTLTACPPSCCASLGTTTTSATYSTATPAGVAPRKSRFGTTSTATWEVEPTLLQTGIGYKVYVSKGTTGTCPTDILVDVTAVSGCGLADTNGVARTFIRTPYFQRAFLNQWYAVAIITNTVTNPRIKFAYASGSFDRWYMDEVRFESLDPCSGVAPQPGITGPLAAGQTYVKVTGVVLGATNVTVYANQTNQIGSTNFAAGFAAGTLTVPTTPLVKGDSITATQIKLNPAGDPCSSPPPTSGPVVGGGANPKLILSLGCQKNNSLTGPIGTPTPSPGTDTLYWVKATDTAAGLSATAPVGGWEVTPGTCWQTLYFNWTDPCLNWQSSATYTEANPFAVLESIAIGIDGNALDSGPYDIYLDNIMNGNTVLADFEGYANGTANVNFANPNATATPAPGCFLSAPMSTKIAQNNVASGTNSCRVQFQFTDDSNIRWCRLLMSKAPLIYPQVDTRQPVSVSVLLLPVGSATGHSLGQIGTMTNQTNCLGTALSLSVPTNGTGSYTFVWKKGSSTIAGATDHVYSKSSVAAADAGTYSCIISDGTCSVTNSMVLTVPAAVTIETQPAGPGIAVAIGSAWTFSVSAYITNLCPCANTPALTYQWRLNGANIAGATDTSYPLSSIQLTDAGLYTVLVSNTCNAGTATSTAVQLAVYDPAVTPVAASCGARPNGLLGLYWTNQTSGNAFTLNAPTWTNTDATVNFNWTTGGFNTGLWPAGTNYFTARWFGQVQAPYNGQTYTFYVKSDDGARLWVNGQLLVNRWSTGSSESSGSIVLSSGAPVDILLHYFEQTSSASVILSWSSQSLYKEVIPTTQLCAALDTDPVPPLISLSSPVNNTTVNIGAPVTLTASVTPFTSTIDKVEFYNNATNLIATANSSPYTQSWTPPAGGVYNITARVYYNGVSTLNTPSNKLTVSVPSLIISTGAGSWQVGTTTLSYSGGVGSRFVLLESADPALPLSSWTSVKTNDTGTPGGFTIPAVGTAAPKFYRVRND